MSNKITCLGVVFREKGDAVDLEDGAGVVRAFRNGSTAILERTLRSGEKRYMVRIGEKGTGEFSTPGEALDAMFLRANPYVLVISELSRLFKHED